MTATFATPNIMKDPGALYYAPAGTAIPTFTAVGSVFTHTWGAPWVALGCTEDGSEWSFSITREEIGVAELFYPITYSTTDKNASVKFALADFTMSNVQRVLNGGTISTVSGATSTLIKKYVPVTPGNETSAMIGWQALDDTMVIIGYQCKNAGDVTMSFKKAPTKGVLAVEFQFEKPASTEPFEIYTAGVARVGS